MITVSHPFRLTDVSSYWSDLRVFRPHVFERGSVCYLEKLLSWQFQFSQVTYIWVCNQTSLQAWASMTLLIAKTLDLGVYPLSSGERPPTSQIRNSVIIRSVMWAIFPSRELVPARKMCQGLTSIPFIRSEALSMSMISNCGGWNWWDAYVDGSTFIPGSVKVRHPASVARRSFICTIRTRRMISDVSIQVHTSEYSEADTIVQLWALLNTPPLSLKFPRIHRRQYSLLYQHLD